jgi:hypothetical protein
LPCAQINTTDTQKLVLASVSISDKTTGVSRLINEYIKIPSNIAFIGLRLKSELPWKKLNYSKILSIKW